MNMKQSEIKIGSVYAVKVSGQIAPVRVDSIKASVTLRSSRRQGKARYLGTNLGTGRQVTFTSAKCRHEYPSGSAWLKKLASK